jgi:hypothetical protein
MIPQKYKNGGPDALNEFVKMTVQKGVAAFDGNIGLIKSSTSWKARNTTLTMAG